MIRIDEKACRSCGRCTIRCPLSLIGRDARGAPFFREDGEPCMECGHCVAVCPEEAISLPGLPAEPSRPELLPGGAEVAALLRARRSVRVFSARPVPRELLVEVLEATRHAPSAKNTQPVQWTVLEDPAKVRALAARFLAAYQANPTPTMRRRQLRPGEDPVFRGAPHLLVAHTPPGTLWCGDAVIAATYAEVAAAALGLGACWSGIALPSAGGGPALAAAAGIPADHAIGAVLLIGHPAEPFRRVPARKPLRVSWV